MGSHQFWEVVGGKEGGILVRAGKDLSSPALPDRLAHGAIVRELELEGARLHYERKAGAGPDEGWVSVSLKGKPLVARQIAPAVVADKALDEVSLVGLAVAAPAEQLKSIEKPTVAPPVEGRKIRVLALHGCPGNSNLMKFMCATFKGLAGSAVEWVFADGGCPWAPVPGSSLPSMTEPSDFVKRVAGKKPLVAWYGHPLEQKPLRRRKDTNDFEGVATYDKVEEGLQHLEECLRRESPIDVVVAFSQSASLCGMLVDALRRRGEDPPWRLSVFFCGAMIDDPDLQFDALSAHPTLYVVGGEADGYAYGKRLLPLMYSNLKVWEHSDGHVLPTSQPRAGEIYTEILAEMGRACGGG